MDKKEILKEFSADPGRYYNVKLFQEQGFVRKACSKEIPPWVKILQGIGQTI